MRYFWHGAFVGAFIFAPWWTTAILGAVLAVKYCPEILIISIFFLMDIIYSPSAEHFYFSMPLSLGATIFILLARFLRARVWSTMIN